MSTSTILNLKPLNVWKHFYALTRIPRPTGQMAEVTEYVKKIGNKLNLEVKQDKVNNVVIIKPATKGFESKDTVILQAHLDMVPQKNSDVTHDFTKDPIDAYIDGDVVRARSTTLGADNGIGAAMMLAILEDESLKHPQIEALFTTDEEEGMDGAFGLKKGFLEGKLMLNLDTEEDGELCVGCAGGADVNVVFGFKDDTELDAGDVAFKISLTGLKGGHSGTDIHLGRANANKLMNRFLKEIVRNYEARLSNIHGGSLRNAIPRESFAVVCIPEQLSDDLQDLVLEYEGLFREEFTGTEESISFKAEKTDKPSTLLPVEVQDDLINAVEGCPNGVISMLAEFPDTVESSLNLALVQSSPERIDVKLLVRSSSESRKEWVCSSVESVFLLAGANVKIEGDYPGWQPNAHSNLLHSMELIYLEKYGERPHVNVIHAGLECGIIQSNVNPDLDIVSFGPTIGGAHSPDEYVEIAAVEKSYDYLLAILEVIG
ncbi:MAG: aminoacyl-histidine dipeptidase [Dysgonamonadaceae bacterium]|nr:aminoacyl-histidine dipeptidase [Dysgonamonadaceae bacterium]MDD4727921.1 aminoacyl-histidine dipeptidase [Dysgonamonadaceae bacterium]